LSCPEYSQHVVSHTVGLVTDVEECRGTVEPNLTGDVYTITAISVYVDGEIGCTTLVMCTRYFF